jgi:beta-lactamase regulating signal transducer with metallopeptidase domain/PAS domain-containing protein
MAEWIASTAAWLVPMLGRALLAFLWQGALIGVLAALALSLLRDARAQVRYAVSCLALLACVLLPLSRIALQWLALAQATMPAPLAPLHADAVIDLSAAAATGWPRGFEEFFPLVVSLWAAGASVLSLRMALGLAWIRGLRATPQGPGQPAWQARLDVLSQKFGSMRRVALRLVDNLDSPVSTGCWRPVVLLPAALVARMPVELVEALLAHELAHVRRHDYLVNLLQCVVEALLFYHPVTWWLSRRIRIEREQIADALAADAIGSPRRLAVALSELSACKPTLATPSRFAPAAHGGQLMSRIQQLVQPGRRVAGGKIALPLIGLAAACIALYANAEQVPRPVPAAVATASVQAMPAPLAIPHPTIASGPVLAMAAAAPAAAPATETRTIRHRDDGDSYALVRKGERGITMSGSSDDIAAIEAARARADRDFIWFSRKGAAYVIDDPATVSRANEAWRDTNAIGKQMETLGAQMQVHGDRMQGLGTQMEKLTAGHQETPEMRSAVAAITALAGKQQALATQQASLGAEMVNADDARRDELERRMDKLGAEMDALSTQMDQHQATLDAATETLEANQAPIEALGRQMEEAGKPMDALGKQMDVLGEQQEASVKRAEATLQALISDAMQRGLAKPASAM